MCGGLYDLNDLLKLLTRILSNRFRLQVYERLIRKIRCNGQSLWTHPNYLLKR